MKERAKPRNVRKPWCRFYCDFVTPSAYIESMSGLDQMRKAHGWLGRVIKYLEQGNDEALPPKA